jgi:hypothetical protein
VTVLIERLARPTLPVLVVALAGALGGCAAPPEDAGEAAPETSADTILGGGIERGWPAVGMLRFATGNFGTGALISPTVVLTAAHVVAGHPTKFFFGTPATGKDPVAEDLRSVDVAETIAHPCYATPKAGGCPGDTIDIALVRLVTPITDVQPLPVVRWPLTYFWNTISPYRGDSCTAVGFGAFLSTDGKASFGMRRSAKSTIDSVGKTELITVRGTGIATSGDSGGPLVCDGYVVGTVRGSSAAQAPDESPYERRKEGYERSDLWRSWISSETKRFEAKSGR